MAIRTAHFDSASRVPFVWRPAPAATEKPSRIAVVLDRLNSVVGDPLIRLRATGAFVLGLMVTATLVGLL